MDLQQIRYTFAYFYLFFAIFYMILSRGLEFSRFQNVSLDAKIDSKSSKRFLKVPEYSKKS
jgi:hypothetical protein